MLPSAQVADKSGPAIVIGAGPSGLAVAGELRKRGIPVEILDRGAAVGSSWRARYDRLRLNTCRWYSMLSKEPFPRGTSVFPARDEFVRYLEHYAERYALSVRFGVAVNRIDPDGDGWVLETSAGPWRARQVVISTGLQHTPNLPNWFRPERFTNRLLHSTHYRGPEEFRGKSVLIVGCGSSGLDIALDLVEGGAGKVRVAVRTVPYLKTRSVGPLPTDLIEEACYRMPLWLGDGVDRIVRRVCVGDLSRWGLPAPLEGFFSWVDHTGGGPVVVDKAAIDAIKANRIEIVPAVETVSADAADTGSGRATLRDGSSLVPDAIIAATGFHSGLEPLVGHLGVLDIEGRPAAFGGPPAKPGLRFSGYIANINNLYNDGRRVAEEISREWAADGRVLQESARAW